jgi:hypothetical protein
MRSEHRRVDAVASPATPGDAAASSQKPLAGFERRQYLCAAPVSDKTLFIMRSLIHSASR